MPFLYAFYYCDCVREAGFEPALPREHRLKRCVLNHSTIRAKHYWVLLAGLEPATVGS